MAKNLGQVEGLYIGSSAPTNTALIWYDTSSNKHKVYDTSLSAWKVLDPTSITAITYSALTSRASGTGLTQGQWFKITDRSNALALAITSTKVQYVNNNGVFVIDDLGTHIIYSVTSENLIIDDVAGVYNTSTNKLVFSFTETTPVMNTGDTDVDYVYGLQKRGNTKTQRKFRLSSFLSAVTGNDISWNGGFFLNFYNKLKNYFNVTGGVATHEALESYKTLNNQAIQQIGENTQQAITQVGQNINAATTNQQIYGKQLPTAPTSGTPVDIAQNDTLSTIINKIYRWIQKFKKADGISMPSNYAPAPSASQPTNSDTVSGAIAKLAKYASKHENGDGIKVSGSTLVPYTQAPSDIVNTDDLKTAVNKLIWLVKHINTSQINDNAITERKLAAGVQLTDICRMDISVTWAGSMDPEYALLNLLSTGFCLNAGNSGLFQYAQTDPDNPYRITQEYWDGYDDFPVISFATVIAPQNNTDANYNIAAPMLHYTGHWGLDPHTLPDEYKWWGAYFQSMVVLHQTLYDWLDTNDYNYLKVTIQEVDLYDATFQPSQRVIYVSLARVCVWGFQIPYANLQNRTGRHLIVKVNFTFTKTQS